MMTVIPAHAEAIGAACTNTLLAEHNKGLLDKMMYQHRYSPVHRSMFVGMVGALYNRNKAQAITRLLDQTKWPLEALGLQHLLLQLRCMNHCINLTPDKAEQEHIQQQCAPLIQALFQWIRIVKSHDQDRGLRKLLLETDKKHFNHIIQPQKFDEICAQTPWDNKGEIIITTNNALQTPAYCMPHQLRAVLETLFKASNVTSQLVYRFSPDTQKPAKSPIERALRKDPKLVDSTINALTTSSRESNARSRANAARTFGDVVQEAPGRAEEISKILLRLCKDADWQVCANAILSTEKLVKVSPVHAEAIFEVLLHLYTDQGAPSAVQTAAVMALGAVVKVARIHTKDVLKAFTSALDQDVGLPMRIATILALGDVAQADADQAKHILKVLITNLKRANYRSFRAAVAFILGEIGKIAPACADIALKTVLVACTDEDVTTRIAAAHSFNKIVEGAPPAAERALKEYATSEFIEIYCHNEHMREALLPRLLHRLLYAEALVIDKSGKLTVHQAAGTHTWAVGTLPEAGVRALKKALADYKKQHDVLMAGEDQKVAREG